MLLTYIIVILCHHVSQCTCSIPWSHACYHVSLCNLFLGAGHASWHQERQCASVWWLQSSQNLWCGFGTHHGQHLQWEQEHSGHFCLLCTRNAAQLQVQPFANFASTSWLLFVGSGEFDEWQVRNVRSGMIADAQQAIKHFAGLLPTHSVCETMAAFSIISVTRCNSPSLCHAGNIA